MRYLHRKGGNMGSHITKQELQDRIEVLEILMFGRSVHPECSHTSAYIGTGPTQLCEHPQNGGDLDSVDEPALPRCNLNDCPVMKGEG